MINTFLGDLISIICSIKFSGMRMRARQKGMRARQKSKEDKENAWKIWCLMYTGLDLKFSDLCNKNSVVFQLRKLNIIGDTLNNSKYFIIQSGERYQRPFCYIPMP